jgi:cyclohexanone monooxygenase
MFADMPDERARRRIWESGWEAGGFRFLFETFDDLLFNPECNEEATEFVRDKIRAIVHDPETAELLCPKDHPLGGKRPPLGHFYYEAYNRPNVSLVSVKDNAIEEITPKGIKLADGTEHEVDVIVLALGFDAITGSLTSMDVRGRGGKTIKDAWETEAPQQHFGLTGADFPNMFTMAGPQGPFSNFHAFLNPQAVYVRKLLASMQEKGRTKVEVRPEVAAAWADLCEQILNQTLVPHGASARSWLVGANVEGKRSKTLFYLGGVNTYVDELQKHIDSDFEGFVFDSELQPA